MDELERFWRTDDRLTAREQAEAFGIDLSLIEENLRLTVDERLAKHSSAASLILELRGGLTHGQ